MFGMVSAPYTFYRYCTIISVEYQWNPFRPLSLPSLHILLAVGRVGLYAIYSAANANQIQFTAQSIGILAISLIVLAGGFGAARALTSRIWIENGIKMRRGTVLTFTLWIITMAAHIYLDTLVKGSDITTLLYMGISLYVQQRVIVMRANNLEVSC